MQQTINEAKALVDNKLGGDIAGHDYYHVARVVNLSLQIAEKEGFKDLPKVELLAWIHDLTDVKLVDDVKQEQLQLKTWLSSRLPEKEVAVLMQALSEIGYKGGQMNATTTLSKIVNDADKLDAIGAIGIARCFAFGAHKQQAMYVPTIKPQSFDTEAEYRQLKSTSFNHISEKLLKLKDCLYTITAKELAKPRHDFLLQFVAQFEVEVGV
jgi:uncharacterized protein